MRERAPVQCKAKKADRIGQQMSAVSPVSGCQMMPAARISADSRCKAKKTNTQQKPKISQQHGRQAMQDCHSSLKIPEALNERRYRKILWFFRFLYRFLVLMFGMFGI